MRFMSTRMHALADYLVGILLIISPYIFGFPTGGVAQWLPMLLGAGVIVYSMLTRYELGLLPVIGMPVHLGLDAGGGVLLAVSPWLFGFSDVVWLPHLIIGLVEIGAALTTSTRSETPQLLTVAGRRNMAAGLVIGIAAVLAIVVVGAVMSTDNGATADRWGIAEDTARTGDGAALE